MKKAKSKITLTVSALVILAVATSTVVVMNQAKAASPIWTIEEIIIVAELGLVEGDRRHTNLLTYIDWLTLGEGMPEAETHLANMKTALDDSLKEIDDLYALRELMVQDDGTNAATFVVIMFQHERKFNALLKVAHAHGNLAVLAIDEASEGDGDGGF